MSFINNITTKIDNAMLDGGGKLLGGEFKNLKDVKNNSQAFSKDVAKDPSKYFGDGKGNEKVPDLKELQDMSSKWNAQHQSGNIK